MRYAIFTDIHANLEALEAVLAKIEELALQESIDQIWFLGDLVGYGPNPNECIEKLRERTDVIIAGNHDWAAVGKIDIEDFSEAARISAEWTAEQLTEENRTFLTNLPESIEIDECLLVHGSPYGPLWEYLTSEVLAERSFQHFTNRFCFVGHTHVPIIFQQPDTVANSPTLPLEIRSVTEPTSSEENIEEGFDEHASANGTSTDKADETRLAGDDEDSDDEDSFDDQETTQIAAIRPKVQMAKAANQAENAHVEKESLQDIVADATDVLAEIKQHIADDNHGLTTAASEDEENGDGNGNGEEDEEDRDGDGEEDEKDGNGEEDEGGEEDEDTSGEAVEYLFTETEEQEIEDEDDREIAEEITPEETILSAEERLNEEIEELLSLLGLSQRMVTVTNEMIVPPEGEWQAPEGYRAIINPGGVGQPRDGDSRAAFMIYDTERGFTFYRIPYTIEKTQEKIIKVHLPQYLAARLAYGR